MLYITSSRIIKEYKMSKSGMNCQLKTIIAVALETCHPSEEG